MKQYVLILIVLIGFALRSVLLSSSPSGFTPDEASFGYDAYSLLKTGKDQWGEPWPLTFRSFGDYKLPLYTYLAMPSIAAFGLNEFATRLPNAVLGTLAIVATYMLVSELYKDKSIALISAFLVSISPWHIPLSRGAFEANLTTFFMPLGIFFFLKGIKRRSYLYFSAIIFLLNMFSYHSARLLTPLIIGYLVFMHWKILKSDKIKLLSVGIMLLFVAISLWMMFGIGGSRASTAAIFNPTGGWGALADTRYGATLIGMPDLIARMFHNKLIFLVTAFIQNYVTYFSPQYLLTEGAHEGTYGMVPGAGVIYFIDFIGILGFIWALLTKKVKNVGLLVFWLFISPIPASLAKGPGYAANRAAFMIPAIQIITALGLAYLILDLKLLKKHIKYVSLGLVGIYLLSLIFFLENYLYVQKINQSQSMIYGISDMFKSLNTLRQADDQIIISKRVSEPQIYVAFFEKMNPSEYQKQSRDWLRYEREGLSWVDQLGEYKLGQFTFKSLSTEDFKDTNILIGNPDEIVNRGFVLNTIYYPNNKPAFVIAKGK